MTTTLTTSDLQTLSIFKCKMCSLRLDSPIMEMVAFGNICGSCFSRSVYTNTMRNVEMEALLAKLHVSCRFVERGCTFGGDYSKMNEHEEMCCYRKILCPFSFEEKCAEYLFIKDLIEHIQKKHSDSAIELPFRPHVKNPTKECPRNCYFTYVNGVHLLLRTNLNIEKQRISYDFYHFNHENWNSRKRTLSLKIEHDDCVLNINPDVYVRHISAIADSSGTTSQWKSPKLKMKSLNFLKSVRFFSCYVPTTSEKPYRSCPSCDYSRIQCYSCNKSFHVTEKYKCKNEGCEQSIDPLEAAHHATFQCSFKKYVCPFESKNNWCGVLEEFRSHMQNHHKDELDRNEYILQYNKKLTSYFNIGNDFFEQTFNYDYTGFSVDTLKFTFDSGDVYISEVHVRKIHEVVGIVISNNCTFASQKSLVNLSYIIGEDARHQRPLRVNTYFKRLPQ